MTATPADVAKYTSDGIVITVDNPAILTDHPEAQDLSTSELEMFFVDPEHAQVMLEERFALLSQVDALHEAVVVDESLLLGDDVALTPSTPCFRCVDDKRGIDRVLRTRAYAYQSETDQYSIELVS